MQLIAIVLLLAAAPATTPDLDQLQWMTGHWRGTVRGVEMEELWTDARGGMMLGLHRDVKDGRGAGFEFIRIAKTDTGIVYLASPGGRPPTPFPLKEIRGTRVVFENPAHDFPQRIVYWRNGTKLCARIEGTMKGKEAGEEWCWSK